MDKLHIAVRYDRNRTNPLGEESDGKNDPHSLPVTHSSEQTGPSTTLVGLPLQPDSSLDFIELESGQRVILIFVTVILDKEGHGLLLSTVVDLPSR
jgi:hypothetical protein